LLPVARDDAIACTIKTWAGAKWHVHIQRQRSRDEFAVALAHMVRKLGWPKL
jgi:hypothetical protein